MKLSMSRKILIVAIVLFIVTITSSFITYQYISRVSKNSLRVLNVELPLEESFLEMEIGLSESSRAVLDYIQDYQEKHLYVLLYAESNFEANIEEYISLCETEREKNVCSEIAQLYNQFANLGFEIIDLKDKQNEALHDLREQSWYITFLLEDFAEYYVNWDKSSPYDKGNMKSIFEFTMIVGELHAGVEGVLAKHNPGYVPDMNYFSPKLESAYHTYRNTLGTVSERIYLEEIYTDLIELFVMSEEILQNEEFLSEKLKEFESNREKIEFKLENQIKKMVNEKKENAAQEALSSSRLTLNSSILDSIFSFALMGGLLFGVNFWIISPILSLSVGIKKFAAGNLDEKIEINSKDEIGELASAFNNMTTQIEEKIDTILKNEKKLEELNVDLENEIETRKKYEKEVLRVAREAEVDRLRSQFLSTITHELRTPLTSIKGYIEILRSGWVGNITLEMKETLDIILRNTDRLSTLTSDLLDVQRIESGRLEVEVESINLIEVIEQCIREFRPILLEKEQILDTDILDLPLMVMGDSTRLSQVLMNLLTNASKFSEEKTRIYLRTQDLNDEILISVHDTGIGIKETDLERVFEPLAMIDKPMYVKGTGLGLSISKGIIELHGGKIWAVSEGEWRGSTFYVQLPKIKENDM
jgi:signal transduction histidine kinase